MSSLRIPTALAAAALAAGVAGGVPAAAGAAKPLCDDRTGVTVVRTSAVRVFTTFRPSRTDSDAGTLRLYRCKPGSRKSPKLLQRFNNSLDGSSRITSAELGGDRWLAIGVDSESGVADTAGVLLYDLTSSATNRFQASYSRETNGQVDYAVTKDGGLAVAEEDGRLVGFSAAAPVTLAPAGSTDLASAGSRVYWTAPGGAPGSAVLGSAASGTLTPPAS